jgi:hypothetical protein
MKKTLLLSVLVIFFLGKDAAQAADYYVATNGKDAWSGKLAEPNSSGTDGPWATLARARDAVRSLKAGGGLREAVTVYVRSGHYRLAEPFVLTPEDSGAAACPVTYAAQPGEQPVLSGGRLIQGWQPADGGLWRAELPEVKAGKWDFRTLWVNGQRRLRPRLPKEGAYPLAGGAPPDASAFRFRPGDFRPEWAGRDEIEVVVLQYWTEARLHIGKIDPAAHVVTFTGGSWRPLTWSMGYYVDNVREALGEPGQWYLDRKAGSLLYKPVPGETMDRVEVVAPALEHVVRLEGKPEAGALVEHVSFQGLHFAHAEWKLPGAGLAYPQGELPVAAMFTAQGAA